jgi:hypothetical protein
MYEGKPLPLLSSKRTASDSDEARARRMRKHGAIESQSAGTPSFGVFLTTTLISPFQQPVTPLIIYKDRESDRRPAHTCARNVRVADDLTTPFRRA